MKTAEQFQQFYQTDLLPRLEPLEADRKQVVRRIVLAGTVAAVVMLAAIILTIAQILHQAILVFVFIIVFGLFFWRAYAVTRVYVAEFKGSVIRPIISFVDPGLTYDRTGYIPQSTYLNSGLFLQMPDRYRGEDLVRGRIGKTEIQFSELHTEYKTTTTDGKGRRHTQWHTIFRGIYFVADFNKHFQGRTVVLPDIAERLFGRLGQKFQSWNVGRGELVRLEDPEFEKRFVVYADDQIEARYLLSLSLMSRIMEYMDRTGCWICLAFVASQIHVAIAYQKDLFEPSLFKPITDPKLAEGYLQDLRLVLSIVEELDLNRRIWTKQ